MTNTNKMPKGCVNCSECGKDLSELPFPIYCEECWSKRKGTGQDRMFKGSWKCAECDAEITELPFQPTEDRPVYCETCWAKREDK